MHRLGAALFDAFDERLHGQRAEVYLARRKHESSLMAKGIFAGAARESRAVADG